MILGFILGATLGILFMLCIDILSRTHKSKKYNEPIEFYRMEINKFKNIKEKNNGND